MNKESRAKKALVNTTSELLLEVVTAICSFILPRLILSHFGSAYNGITTSISQFIGCVALLKSGIGSVTRASLYKPLAVSDYHGISEIVNATQGFMKRIAWIFLGGVFVFAAVYPFLVSNEFSWMFSFTLVLILSAGTFVQYYAGLSYQMVLQADQKNYIISIANIVTTIANTLVAAVLILSGFGIHTVKLGSAVVFSVAPIFYNVWVTRKYHIDPTVNPNTQMIAQRWDAFGQQVTNFITLNTDVMLATVFLDIKEVSVYGIFSMITNAVKKAVMAIGSGTNAAFGNMIAKGEKVLLTKRFSQYEVLIYYVTTSLATVTALMIVPFIRVYTKGVDDVNYDRYIFGLLMSGVLYFMCIKAPYEQLVFARGDFRQTRNSAFVEAGLNIGLSVILVNFIGLSGLAIGTIVSLVYRIVVFHSYISRNILDRPLWGILKKVLYSVVAIGAAWTVSLLFDYSGIDNYMQWFIAALYTTVIVLLIDSLLVFLFFPGEARAIVDIGVRTVKRR